MQPVGSRAVYSRKVVSNNHNNHMQANSVPIFLSS